MKPKGYYRVHNSLPIPRLCITLRNKLFLFYDKLLAPRPTPETEGPSLIGCSYIRST
jgi:hypothetical protein